MGGAITVVDSTWKMGFVLYGNHYYPDQPEDVDVFWVHGQLSDVPGDYIRKPMRDCSGAEMLYQLLPRAEAIERIVAASYVSIEPPSTPRPIPELARAT
jgi:oleate hydratase